MCEMPGSMRLDVQVANQEDRLIGTTTDLDIASKVRNVWWYGSVGLSFLYSINSHLWIET